MKINDVLIDRGKLGKDRTIIDLKGITFEGKIPVCLNNDGANVIGEAEINVKPDGLFANITIPSNKNYLLLYPAIVIGITGTHNRGSIRVIDNSRLISISLSGLPNHDPKIKTLNKKS